jgi:hypothetical protein
MKLEVELYILKFLLQQSLYLLQNKEFQKLHRDLINLLLRSLVALLLSLFNIMGLIEMKISSKKQPQFKENMMLF